MFRLMITTHDSNNEGFCIAEDFESETAAWDFWNEESNEWPEMDGVWVEAVSGRDEFFQGWDAEEANDAWDGES